MLAAVLATAVVQCLPKMPDQRSWLAVLVMAGLLATFGLGLHALRATRWGVVVWPLCVGLLAVAVTISRIESRLADALDTINVDKVSRVVLQVGGLVRVRPGSRQFEARVLSSIPEGVPESIVVNWNAPGYAGPYSLPTEPEGYFPDLEPGQVWRMALNLRPIHGARNPHGFDYEGHMFAQGLRATGSVRGNPRYQRNEFWSSLQIIAERARHHVRQAMLPYTHDKRYGAVLLALAIGDQASVEASDWEVFNRTGISHLVSISGSHITMIAAMAGVSAWWGWRRMRWRQHALAEHFPAQIASALAALFVAWLYCLLAGWGVPARRTFFMLCAGATVHALRLPVTGMTLLCCVAFVVVLLDPWALMATGFWLSFGAFTVLLITGSWWGTEYGRSSRRRGAIWKLRLRQACAIQLAISAGLMPILALLFHEVSLASPLANSYAIPVIGVVVTPLALLLAGLSLVPGLDSVASVIAWLAHGALSLSMIPTLWLAEWNLASFDAAAAPIWVTGLGLVGLLIALVPHGLPWRHAGWLLMLPGLAWRPASPPHGGWQLHALDVGQAGAIVVRTARHTLVFDAGLRSSPVSDGAMRTIIPFLRSQGVRRIDALVVSHADIDHVGGVRSLLGAFPVTQAYSSFDLQAYLEREGRMLDREHVPVPAPGVWSQCSYGQHWDIDGVSFQFLWPTATATSGRSNSRKRSASRERNAQGCVLRVQGAYHSALLTGDIGQAEERQLIERGLNDVAVVMAAHHGSKSSSDTAFVRALEASQVVAQAGRYNRYGHPHPDVQKRWERSGATFWRTDLDGAITIHSDERGLAAQSTRAASPRYWQNR